MTSQTPTILYISLWPWDELWQRPQHIAKQLSGHYNLIYSSPIPFRSKKKASINYIKKVYHLEENRIDNNLTVLNYQFLPAWRFSFLSKLNYQKWLNSIKKYIKSRNLTIEILWISSPDHLLFIKNIKCNLRCYDCMDNYPMFNAKLLLPEQEIFKIANVVFVSADSLEKKAKIFNDNVHLISDRS